jgi:hypothetical protein
MNKILKVFGFFYNNRLLIGFLLMGIIFSCGCTDVGNPQVNKNSSNNSIISKNKVIITINPIQSHAEGDIFEISGSTTLGLDQQLKIEVAEDYFRAKRTRNDGIFYGVAGNATIIEGINGINRWVFNVNTTGWLPQQYYVDVFSSSEDSSSHSDFYLIRP